MAQSLTSQIREANAAVRSGSGYAFARIRPGQSRIGDEDEGLRLGGRRRIFRARQRDGRFEVQPMASQRWYEADEDSLEVDWPRGLRRR